MTSDMQDANDLVRDAVQMRMAAQAEGRPHDDWYDPAAATTCRGPSASEVLERFAPEHPGSLPFLELVEELRQLHIRKSQDYGTRSDPLANVRNAADLIGIEPWRAGLVRVAEKVQRIRAFCHNGRLANEGVRDSLIDLAAYSLIVAVLFDEASRGG